MLREKAEYFFLFRTHKKRFIIGDPVLLNSIPEKQNQLEKRQNIITNDDQKYNLAFYLTLTSTLLINLFFKRMIYFKASQFLMTSTIN